MAVAFATEIGDIRRFDNPRQLMAYLDLVPSERSTGDTVWRGDITKAGNGRVHYMLDRTGYLAEIGRLALALGDGNERALAAEVLRGLTRLTPWPDSNGLHADGL